MLYLYKCMCVCICTGVYTCISNTKVYVCVYICIERESEVLDLKNDFGRMGR